VKDPVRVLLLEVPPLLRGVLEHAVQVQSGWELLKDARRSAARLIDQQVPPDIIILGLTAAEDTTLVAALFARWPTAHVMTVMQGGRDAAVYELRLRRQEIGEPSPDEIVATLREAVDRSRAAAQE
jgi:hypothetical protein